MIIKDALTEGRHRLSSAGFAEASLESELLLRRILSVDATNLFLRYNSQLSPEQIQAYNALISRRISGVPTAYLIGEREFYGLTVYVNHSVLIPRPETELLVSQTISAAGYYSNPVIVDVGTGSGAIAVALARHLPQAKFYAVDISQDALAVARRNAFRHGVLDKISFLLGDLLFPLPEPADIIAANLPYVNSGELPDTGEPRTALDGGEGGLDIITRLIRELPNKLNSEANVLIEVGAGQADNVCRLLGAALPTSSVQVFSDLAGIARVVQATISQR